MAELVDALASNAVTVGLGVQSSPEHHNMQITPNSLKYVKLSVVFWWGTNVYNYSGKYLLISGIYYFIRRSVI